MARRALKDLLSDEDAWPDVEAWAAGDRVRVVPAERRHGERVLQELQVTTRSPMGAVALHAAHLAVDGGWVHVLGAGDGQGPSLADPLGTGDGFPIDLADGLLVAHDAIGGFFAVDGGGLGVEPGEVLLLAPDTAEWEGTGMGYGDWLRWLCDGGAARRYADLRWDGWEAEVAGLGAGRALHLHPPPWSREGRDVGGASRRPVPVAELFHVAMGTREQLGGR